MTAPLSYGCLRIVIVSRMIYFERYLTLSLYEIFNIRIHDGK